MTHPAHPERRRILVIDDTEAIHADFRKTLEPQAASESFVAAKSAFLGGAGKTRKSKAPLFAVDCAHQGQDGVRMVEAAKNAGDPYLVAFVDMRMPPGWDGVTTIKHLWAVDPDVHVVICTAFSDDSLDAIAEELGRSDQLLILKKPFDTVEVAQLAAAAQRETPCPACGAKPHGRSRAIGARAHRGDRARHAARQADGSAQSGAVAQPPGRLFGAATPRSAATIRRAVPGTSTVSRWSTTVSGTRSAT